MVDRVSSYFGRIFLVVVCSAGCAQSVAPQASAPDRPWVSLDTAPSEDVSSWAVASAPAGEQRSEATPANSAGPLEPLAGSPLLDRKIIYTANLAIEVERFDPLPAAVNQLATQFGGYIANTSVSQLQGNRRSGSWTIRVPVERYREFLGSASGLGVPQSLRESANDVSEQFVDLEARIASGKKLEGQIMQLLEKQSDKIDDLLAIERELARVRLEIESLEGRLRLLANQVAMSTVHLAAQEKLTYLPPERLTLSRRAALEWTEAVGRLARFCEDSLIGLIGNAFVILAWCLAGLVGWLVFRAWRRHAARSATAEL